MTRTLFLVLLLFSVGCQAQTHPGSDAFVERALSEYGLEPDEVLGVIGDAEFKESIVKAMRRPAEGKPWHEYREIFLNDRRIDGGVDFWKENRDLIEKAAREFGVEPQFIVSIIGVETLYGRITGSYRVIDALATLGFYYPVDTGRDRSAFFSDELMQFILLSRTEELPIREVTGSYAGAMGMGQFMPSSYREYAVDFDDDGKRDLWRSTADVVGSVANYLHRHGWATGEPVTARAIARSEADFEQVDKHDFKPKKTVSDLEAAGFVSSPDLVPGQKAALLSLELESRSIYYLTFKNFYVITRYNRSPLYAMAVYELSEAIREGMEGS
jgi:membrane-bound lytic murein transglycosylase B